MDSCVRNASEHTNDLIDSVWTDTNGVMNGVGVFPNTKLTDEDHEEDWINS